eukprot:scaffold19548_cov50-Phaeocystis_antarctica.AAC.1
MLPIWNDAQQAAAVAAASRPPASVAPAVPRTRTPSDDVGPCDATTADPGVLCCRTLGATRCRGAPPRSIGHGEAASFSGFLAGATGHGRLAGAAVAGRARRALCAAIATAPLAMPRGGAGTARHAAGSGARRRRVGEHAPRRRRRGLSRACAVTAAAATAAADGGGAGACPRPTDEAQGRGCTPVGRTHLDAEGATRDGLGGVGDRDHGCRGASEGGHAHSRAAERHVRDSVGAVSARRDPSINQAGRSDDGHPERALAFSGTPCHAAPVAICIPSGHCEAGRLAEHGMRDATARRLAARCLECTRLHLHEHRCVAPAVATRVTAVQREPPVAARHALGREAQPRSLHAHLAHHRLAALAALAALVGWLSAQVRVKVRVKLLSTVATPLRSTSGGRRGGRRGGRGPPGRLGGGGERGGGECGGG